MDAGTGLTYMQQRYYDPAIGRFLSVDPVTANSGTGANFNRYWYANNNPYKFIDPDGRMICNRSRSSFWGCQTDPIGGGCQRVYACLDKNGRDNKDGKSTHSKKDPPTTTIETTIVRPEPDESGWYGSMMEPNNTFELAAADGAGLRYKRNVVTKKDALGIVFLGVGAHGKASKAFDVPSIDYLKGGYNWGGIDAPIDIELNGKIWGIGAGLEFDPGKGIQATLTGSIGGGTYVGGSVMFDDTLVPDR